MTVSSDTDSVDRRTESVSPIRDLSDEQLLQMSAEPPRDLIPQMSAAARLTPLIVAWALLPGCYALVRRTFDERDALWALRSLAVSQAETWQAFLEAGTPGGTTPLPGRPPLASWIAAGVHRLTGQPSLAGPIGVSYIAAVIAAFAIVGIAWRLSGGRAATFTGVALVFHAQWLRTLQTLAPNALTLACVAVCVWACITTFQARQRLWWCVLLGGVSFGLCILSGGIACLEVVILLIPLVWLNHGPWTSEEVPAIFSYRHARRRRWLTFLAVISLGSLLGMWWVVWMTLRHGRQFLWQWLDPDIHLQNPLARELSARRDADVETLIELTLSDWGVWLGLLFVGAVYVTPAVRPLVQRKRLTGDWSGPPEAPVPMPDDQIPNAEWEHQERRTTISLYVPAIWFVLTAALVFFFSVFGGEKDLFSERWSTLLLIPGTLIVGTTFNRITTRELELRPVLAIIVLGACIQAILLTIPGVLTPGQVQLFELLLFPQLALALVLLWSAQSGREIAKRWALRGWLVLITLAASLNGMIAVDRAGPDDARLRYVERRLAAVQDVDVVVFVTRQLQLAPQLQWLTRSRWPDAREIYVDSHSPSGLAAAVNDASTLSKPVLVLYWTRREYRPVIEPQLRLRVSRLIDPVRYHQRQLGAYLLTHDILASRYDGEYEWP